MAELFIGLELWYPGDPVPESERYVCSPSGMVHARPREADGILFSEYTYCGRWAGPWVFWPPPVRCTQCLRAMERE